MMFTDINEYIKLPQEARQQHIVLDDACIEIGGRSDSFRGLLAHYLRTTIPKGMKIYACHACHNGKCSNVRHLYWGTAGENNHDAFDNGKVVWNKGKLLSEEHKQNLRLSAKKIINCV